MDKCSGQSRGVALCYRSILVHSLHGKRSLLTIEWDAFPGAGFKRLLGYRQGEIAAAG
jgi:hypothetical protein